MKAKVSAFLDHPRWVMALALAVVMAFWIQYLFSLGGRFGEPFEGFLHGGAVVNGATPQNWTGWRAGLRMGDVIVTANGHPWTDLRWVLVGAGVGGTVVYTVLRDAQTLYFAVPTMQFNLGLVLWLLPAPLLFSAICMAVGLYVYASHPSGESNRLMLLYHSMWAMGAAILWNTAVGLGAVSYALVYAQAAFPKAVGAHFFWTFAAGRWRRELLRRWHVIGAFYLWAALYALFPVYEMVLTRLNRPELWNLYGRVSATFILIASVGSLVVEPLPALLVALSRKTAPLLRRQALLLALAVVIFYGAFVALAWGPIGNRYPARIDVMWAYVILTGYPLTIGYAVLRYQLFDISVVVRKGLVYSILTAGLMALFLGLSAAIGYLFQRLLGQQTFLTAVFPALLVGLLFRPALGRVQTFVDRAFFRHEYEVRQTLTGFGRGLSTLRDQDEVTRLVLDTVTQTLGAEQATFWLLDAEHKAYRPIRQAYELAETAEVLKELPAESEIPFWLFTERRALLLPPRDTSWQAQQLHQLGAVLVVPLIAGQRLLGFLTLGTKRSGLLYTNDDLDLLASLAQSAALALENARLHEEHLWFLRQQLAEVTAAQEEERQRIARELHDGVGPALASLNLRLRWLSKLVEPVPAAARELKDLANMTQANIQDIRRLIYDLRPAALDELGLVAALKEYAQRYQHEQGLAVALSVPEGKERLPAPLETTLFRVIQEALTNAARHARATQVNIALDWNAAQVTLRIADDGQGFDQREAAAQAKGGQHLGLWSMRERIEQLGGHVQIDSQPGSGTTIEATVPLTETKA
jgi:signal transduction histidine kinase